MEEIRRLQNIRVKLLDLRLVMECSTLLGWVDQHLASTSAITLPNIDWNDPYFGLVDLTGDGRDDILVTENEALDMGPFSG